jgi:Zeta toxin
MSEPNWEKLREEMGDNVLVEIPLDNLRRDRAAMLAAGTYEETKHPRYQKGTKTAGKVKGGRFAPKGTSGAKGGEEEEQAKPGQGADVTTILDQQLFRATLAKAAEPPPAAYAWPPPLPETAAKLGFGDATESRLLDHVKTGDSYTPERLVLHSDIIGKFLDQSGMVKQEHPETLFMAGGSGAGKSSVLGKQKTDGSGVFEGGVLEDIPANAVYINPDDIKELIPEYDAMVKLKDPGAASFVHEESSDISKKLLATAEARGYNVVLDGTGDSGVGKFYDKVARAESLGRGTRVVMVDIPTTTAIERAMERAKKSGRMVPESEIRLVHKNVAANFIQWREKVADWELWDNSGEHNPKIVAKRKPS